MKVPTVIDWLSTAGGSDSSATDSKYIGQLFTAAGPALERVEFPFRASLGPDTAGEFRLLITTASFSGNGFHPGSVLYESPIISSPVTTQTEPEILVVDVGGVELQTGQKYAFILDFFAASDGQTSATTTYKSHAGPYGLPDYPGGYAVSLFPTDGNRASHFAADWGDGTSVDASFRLTFSNPGPTIIGTKGKDRVDGSRSVGDQPFAAATDDIIRGKGGKDNLSGLDGDDLIDGGKDDDRINGGAGDDQLIGGKGGDRLTGEDGLDQFVFKTRPKKSEPVDKIVDFTIADDTIVLDNAFFSLPEGGLAVSAFAIGKKASTAEHRILYDSASGKVLFDADGSGKAKAVAFAKIDKGLAPTNDDFFVV